MMSTDTSCKQFAESSPDSFQPYDQIILFGDSLTQGSHDQAGGFAFAPALQHGSFFPLVLALAVSYYPCFSTSRWLWQWMQVLVTDTKKERKELSP